VNLIAQRTLLDAIIHVQEIKVQREVRGMIPQRRKLLSGIIRRTVRQTVLDLLSRKGFLEALREGLPSYQVGKMLDDDEADFWRIAVELEHVTNHASEIDADDANSVALFAQVMCDSIYATLRGG
jgi:hypothetical protein